MERLTAKQYIRDYPLNVQRQPNQLPIDLHYHEFSELVVVFGGRGVHFTRREEYEISAGDCFMAVGVHGYKNPEKLHLANIMFIPDRLRIPWDEARKLPGYHAFFSLEPKFRKRHHFRSRLRLRASELSRVSGLVAAMEKEFILKRPGHEFAVTGFFMELVSFLSEAYAHRETKAYTDLMSLSGIISGMECNFQEPVRVRDLAKSACMSLSRFLRVFRNATGHTPIDYLIRLRMRHACELLVQGDLSVTEIACRVGITDSNYFARQFRRVMSMSPRDYAKRIQQEPMPVRTTHNVGTR